MNTSDREVVLHRPQTRRFIVLFLSCLLFVALIFVSVPFNTIEHAISPPVNSLGNIILYSNSNNTTFTVDQHALSGDHPSVSMTPGTHTITATAAPFITQSCMISHPLQFSDTCLIMGHPGVPDVENSPKPPDIGVVFAFTLHDLSVALSKQALVHIESDIAQFSTATVVHQGNYYAVGTQKNGDISGYPLVSLATASFPLLATISLFRGTNLAGTNQLTCETDIPICGFYLYPRERQPFWAIALPVQISFTMLTAHPIVLMTNVVPIVVFLSLSGGNQWDVLDGATYTAIDATQLWESACDQEKGLVLSLATQHAFRTAGKMVVNAEMNGCAFELWPDHQSLQSDQPAVFLWRFGALLAMNAYAQALLPMLPVAPIQEVTEFVCLSIAAFIAC